MKSVNLEFVTIAFDTTAREISSSFKAYDKALTKNVAVVQTTMQKFCDAWLLENGSSHASCKALGKEIRECEVVSWIVASGAMEKKTFTEYGQSAMRAVYHGVSWEAGLKNNPAYALPGGKVSTPAAKKAGKVSTTDRKAVDATASKLLKQLRLIGLVGLAADVLDILTATLEGFTETQESPE
jgi:hypothetical protein